MWPSLGRVSPLIRLNKVVLPAPLGPMIARRSPAPTIKLTPSTARSPPNSFVSPLRLSATAAGSAIHIGVARRSGPHPQDQQYLHGGKLRSYTGCFKNSSGLDFQNCETAGYVCTTVFQSSPSFRSTLRM